MCTKLYVGVLDNGSFSKCLSEILDTSIDISRIMLYASPGSALEKLVNGDIPDVLVVDLVDKDKGTEQLLITIRQHPKLVNLPIIVIDRRASLRDITLYLKGVDVVKSPVDATKLLSKLKLYGGLQQIQDKLEALLK